VTSDEHVIRAIRNAVDIAMYVEHAGVESCPNAVLIRALNLCALGDTLIVALDLCWRHRAILDRPASETLQAVHDALICEQLEHSI
jgi:hypothetical protein